MVKPAKTTYYYKDSKGKVYAFSSIIQHDDKYADQFDIMDGPYIMVNGKLVKMKVESKNMFTKKMKNKLKIKKVIRLQIESVLKEERLEPGTKIRISTGSGALSNKRGTIVPKSSVETDKDGIPTNVQGAYKPVEWDREVAIRLDSGEIVTMFKDRVKLVDENKQIKKEASPSHPNLEDKTKSVTHYFKTNYQELSKMVGNRDALRSKIETDMEDLNVSDQYKRKFFMGFDDKKSSISLLKYITDVMLSGMNLSTIK